jgi:hypothetical protein
MRKYSAWPYDWRCTVTSRTKVILVGGLFSGLIGYGTVIVVVSLLNLLSGRSPFYTAALFGSALFYGLEDSAALQVEPGPVLAYNMVHVLAFLAIGTVVSWLVSLAEKYPAAQYFTLVALIFVAFHVFGALLLFAEPLLGDGAWVIVSLAGIAAAVTMGWYLLRTHPLLRRELREIPMGDVPPE